VAPSILIEPHSTSEAEDEEDLTDEEQDVINK